MKKEETLKEFIAVIMASELKNEIVVTDKICVKIGNNEILISVKVVGEL